jgi:2-haloacid dehalogenase
VSEPPTTVIFDLGNVLLDWDPRRLYRTLIDDPAELDHFLTEVCSREWHDVQDRGGSTALATEQLQARYPEYAELIGAFYSRWPEMTAGALPATVDVLAELRKAGIRLLALTNWPAETFAPARDRFEFFSWFEGIVVSGDVGVAKPDDEIFSLLLERYQVDPASAVYIDDTTVHVRTARRLGLAGVDYSGATELRRDLAALGLPVRADVSIRPARTADLVALTDIYNHYVMSGPATFDIDPFHAAERREWFDHYAPSGPYRLLVAEQDGRVIGYASSGRFRPKAAYDRSIETTVYLGPGTEGRGVGSMLYQHLFDDLRAEDLHRAYAAITLPNPGSVALHRRFGFAEIGTMREVGHKHGRWWDVLWMERPLP